MSESLQDLRVELGSIYEVLERHGIIVDQVDIADDGVNLWRWIIDRGGYRQESLERWRSPAQALDAILTILFD